jgi:hypothetical protein
MSSLDNDVTGVELADDKGQVKVLEYCFIITPIGSTDSETFRKTTGLLEAVIEPVLGKLNFRALPAHYIASPGSIPKQILKHILEDKLVIANLTGLNPNVMYELAVRHAVKLPLVMMAEVGTELPFDVKDQRTIFYTDNYNGVEKCKIDLEKAIKHVLSDGYEAENPIYDAIESNQIIRNVAPKSEEAYLVERLDRIESMISRSSSNQGSKKPNTIWAGDIGNKINPDGELVIEVRPSQIYLILAKVDDIIGNYGLDVDKTYYNNKIKITKINSSDMTKNELAQQISAIEGVEHVFVL